MHRKMFSIYGITWLDPRLVNNKIWGSIFFKNSHSREEEMNLSMF